MNRRFSHDQDGVPSDKTYGLVVDYHGVSRELKTALESFDWADVEQSMIALPTDPGPIGAAVERAEAHFRGVSLTDRWVCVLRFAADASTEDTYKADAFERFEQDYRELTKLMDQFLLDPQALPYLPRLKRLTETRAYVRAQFMLEDESVNWTAIGAKVKALIDSRVTADVRALMAPVSILDRDFNAKIAGLPHDEARASLMEHAIRAQIKVRPVENPAFYERLSETLQRVIQELHDRLIDAAEACRRMAALRGELRSDVAIAQDEGLTPVAFAVYGLLADQTGAGKRVALDAVPHVLRFLEGLKAVARQVDDVIQRHRSIVDWHLNNDVQREMHRDIKRLLRGTRQADEADLDELARRLVDVARMRPA